MASWCQPGTTWDTLSFQNISPRPWTHTQRAAKAMSRPKPQFVRIVYYIQCYPVDTIVLLLSALKVDLTAKTKQNNSGSAFSFFILEPIWWKLNHISQFILRFRPAGTCDALFCYYFCGVFFSNYAIFQIPPVT